jgi:hypothetical protein
MLRNPDQLRTPGKQSLIGCESRTVLRIILDNSTKIPHLSCISRLVLLHIQVRPLVLAKKI